MTDWDITDLNITDLDIADLENADLDMDNLDMADLDIADFGMSDLEITDLDIANLDMADLDIADFDTAGFDATDFDAADIDLSEFDMAGRRVKTGIEIARSAGNRQPGRDRAVAGAAGQAGYNGAVAGAAGQPGYNGNVAGAADAGQPGYNGNVAGAAGQAGYNGSLGVSGVGHAEAGPSEYNGAVYPDFDPSDMAGYRNESSSQADDAAETIDAVPLGHITPVDTDSSQKGRNAAVDTDASQKDAADAESTGKKRKGVNVAGKIKGWYKGRSAAKHTGRETTIEEPKVNAIEERLVATRLLKLVYLAFVTLFSGFLTGLFHRQPLGELLSLLFINGLFSVLLACYLENDRIHRKGTPDSSEDYMLVCIYYTAGQIVLFTGSFFPGYTAPVFVVSFLLAAGLNRELAVMLAVFLDAQLALNGAASVYMLCCYLVLTLLGAMLTTIYGQKEYRKYAEMIALALCISVPVLFHYLENGVPTVLLILFAFLDGAASILGMHYCYEFLHFRKAQAAEISLDTIVDPNYHLVREIKRYSQVDYNHAMRVSKIAAHCAAEIGANVKISAVGGFYYRLGKLGGEPFIENGVKIAQNNCFPYEIITILGEYNGKNRPISSIESAIVHITDSVVKKFELLDHTTLSSSWNRDIVIYQTMNDKSSSGIYDNSGLTMNQFIKIRDFLKKEEELL